MVFNVKKVGEVFGVPRGTLAAGNLVAADSGSIVNAVGDALLGFVIDDLPTDLPPEMVNCYGEGSILEDTTAPFNVGEILYSDGDGTISNVSPTVAAGAKKWSVGFALSTTQFKVSFDLVEDGTV